MTEKLELVRGSGNVFRDFGDPDAGLEQTRAILAARIIDALDARRLGIRAAERLTGVAASEFSRIRNVKLARFTIDRMITILGKLDQEVELIVKVRPRRKPQAPRRPSAERRPGAVVDEGAPPLRETAHTRAVRRRTPAKVAVSSRRRSRAPAAKKKNEDR